MALALGFCCVVLAAGFGFLRLLGLTFRTLQYRLEKFGIKKPDGKENKDDDEQ